MESNPKVWITVLASSHERLASLADALEGAGLASPSYASEWTIAQVYSHLGSGAEITLLRLDAALAKTDPPEMPAFQQIWENWNAKSPADQCADAITTDRVLLERLAGLSDAELAEVRTPFIGREIGATELVGLRLAEHAVHTWDIAVVQHPSAVIAPDAVALLVDNLGFIATRTAKPSGRSFVTRIETAEPARAFLLSSDGENLALDAATGGAQVDSALALPAEAFIRLVYGRLDPAHTPPDIQATIDGPGLDELRAVFPGF